MQMKMQKQTLFWLGMAVFFFALLYILQGILLPFVLAFAIAYLLDPAVDQIERIKFSKRKKLGRNVGTLIALNLFVLLFVALALLLVPVIQTQVKSIVSVFPQYLKELSQQYNPFMAEIKKQFGMDGLGGIEEVAGQHVSAALGLMNDAFKQVVEGGTALLSLFSVVVITPVVTFYVLRDWDHVIAKLDAWLPREHAPIIRQQMRLVDQTLSGFVRGQGMVCLTLAVFYALSLTVVGLDFGLTIGLFSGLMSFIPYFGTGLGALISIVIAIKQFPDWFSVGLVAGIYAVGQVLEGYVLAPRFVGPRVGLHAVWIIFALMAGGSLFGFVGVLLAVPAAAAIGVWARFGIQQYMKSDYYQGGVKRLR